MFHTCDDILDASVQLSHSIICRNIPKPDLFELELTLDTHSGGLVCFIRSGLTRCLRAGAERI